MPPVACLTALCLYLSLPAPRIGLSKPGRSRPHTPVLPCLIQAVLLDVVLSGMQCRKQQAPLPAKTYEAGTPGACEWEQLRSAAAAAQLYSGPKPCCPSGAALGSRWHHLRAGYRVQVVIDRLSALLGRTNGIGPALVSASLFTSSGAPPTNLS